MRIGFFGAGNMVYALATGILNNKNLKNVQMYFYTPSKVKAQILADNLRQHFVADLSDMPKDLDFYFLGFKPQNLNEFNFNFKPNSNIVSMLAGTSCINLGAKFNDQKIVRIMPNTPSKIFQGLNLIYFANNFQEKEESNLIELMSSCGDLIKVKSEMDLDLITPFSGSGPGIIFELADYFETSLKKIVGEGYDTRKIIAETFLGSAMLMSESDLSFKDLRDQVTSKKGVTFSALEEMRANQVDNIMDKSFHKAIERINEMKRGE